MPTKSTRSSSETSTVATQPSRVLYILADLEHWLRLLDGLSTSEADRISCLLDIKVAELAAEELLGAKDDDGFPVLEVMVRVRNKMKDHGHNMAILSTLIKTRVKNQLQLE